MTDSRERFLGLMKREILKLDLADLDFGIYRILSHRRSEIEAFFDKELPLLLDQAISRKGEQRRTELENQLEELRSDLEQSAEGMGYDSAFEEGEIRPDLGKSPKAVKFLETQNALDSLDQGDVFSRSEEDRLYNVLYTFFSRYYRDGDFQPQQRRAREERYSVPYNGEDVHFHWRSKGSHYVKTTEELKSYSFRSGDWKVRFELVEAFQEPDNVKGSTRYFLPVVDEAGPSETDPKTYVVPFDFRRLTPVEDKRYGKNDDVDGDSVQERIINDLGSAIDPPSSVTKKDLLHHLHRYARKNRTDYFVHPHLGEFLHDELDYYLKNEFLDIEGLTDIASVADRLAKLRVLRQIAGSIIDLLDEIESFQAKLFEKRRFVLSSHYLVPIRLVPEELWEQVLENRNQRQMWKDDLGLSGRVGKGTLESHPSLVVDTSLFESDFVSKLLGSIADLSEMLDGILIESENFGALRTLEQTLAHQVDVLYTDPPYNTGADGFLYKDDFARHSAWLSMMHERLILTRRILRRDGILGCHIDEHEKERLTLAMKAAFGESAWLGELIWDKRNPKGDARGVAVQHESVLLCAADAGGFSDARVSLQREKPNAVAILDQAESIWLEGREKGWDLTLIERKFADWLKNQPFSGGEKAYSRIDEEGRVFRAVSMAWPNRKKAPDEYFEPLIHPFTGEPCPVPARGWRNPPQTMKRLLDADRILFGEDHTTIPNRKYVLSENMIENLPSIIYHGGSDSPLLAAMGLDFDDPAVKPLDVAIQIIDTLGREKLSVLDPFAGSGSTGHAVVQAQRRDGNQRKFILIELPDYFDSVLKRRIVKVMYAPDWKDGSPKKEPEFEKDWPEWLERSPRLVQVIRLESYEDTLNSLGVAEDKLGREHEIRYAIPDSVDESASLLSTQKLESPFDYYLDVHTENGVEPVDVDLVTTFNLMKGIRPKRYRELDHDGRRYVIVEGLEESEPVLVVWRHVAELDPLAEKTFLTESVKAALGRDLAEYSSVYHNADSALPNSVSLDAEFKRLMFEPEPAWT